MSIEVAKNILGYLQQAPTPKYDFEIHVDIGTAGATKILIQEVVAEWAVVAAGERDETKKIFCLLNVNHNNCSRSFNGFPSK